MRVFVVGHAGMVGSAITRQLSKQSDVTLILASRSELDLMDYKAVLNYIELQKPDQIYFAAAKVGGIHANNTYPAEFIADNLLIQFNVINAAYTGGVRKLLFLGSSCIYPQLTKQPIREDCLLTGKLEPTNEPYAIAKIAGIKMCESYNRQYGVDYRSIMPTNLYGENDNFHPQNSHVIPAMMLRFHEAKLAGLDHVVVWGTGKAMREFLYVDDMASACVHVMGLPTKKLTQHILDPMCSHINLGTGKDVTIKELAQLMAKIVNFEGKLVFDKTKPDGTPRKVLNVERLAELGWHYTVELEQGLVQTYEWFLRNRANLRVR